MKSSVAEKAHLSASERALLARDPNINCCNPISWVHEKANLAGCLLIIYAQGRHNAMQARLWSERSIQLSMWKQMCHILLHSPTQGSASRRVKITTKKATIILIQKQRKMTPMLPPVWIMQLLQFRLGSSLYVILRITRIRGPQRLLPLLKVNALNGCRQANWHLSPQGQACRFPHRNQYMTHMNTSNMIGWAIGGRVH